MDAITVIRKIVASLLLVISASITAAAFIGITLYLTLTSPRLPLIIDEAITHFAPSITAELQPHVSEYFTDSRSSAWMKAIEENPVSLSQTLEENGFYAWLSDQSAKLLGQLQASLQTTKETKLELDTTELSVVLSHRSTREFLTSVISRLPSCDVKEIKEWSQFAFNPSSGDLPACNPNQPLVTGMVIDYALNNRLNIPDTFTITESSYLSAWHVSPTAIVLTTLLLTAALGLAGIWISSIIFTRKMKLRHHMAGLTFVLVGATLLIGALIVFSLHLNPELIIQTLPVTGQENLDLIANTPSLIFASNYILSQTQNTIAVRLMLIASPVIVLGTFLLIKGFRQTKKRDTTPLPADHTQP